MITRTAIFEGRIRAGCEAGAATLELLEMFEGRFYHVVSEARTSVGNAP